ncbi:hypothetical protein DY000_02054912 [Brassica cretica]|uniref:Uncharacterized protein n=1 Tax=Brassica cretica TaxID=69181 RepID=A0ABQ7AFB0_BRACR|nr:hypothetical protein DY000_02054912 [Brassica cretica]
MVQQRSEAMEIWRLGRVVGGKQKASSLLLERITVSSSDVTAKVAWTMAGDRAFRKVPFPANVTKHVTMLEYCSDDVPKE